MRSKLAPEETMLARVGMCLLLIQQAEDSLAFAVDTVLSHPGLRLLEQSEVEQKKTVGNLLKKLKNRVRLEYNLKDRLYQFLRMRNSFIHNIKEIPGWNLETEEGRKVANRFLEELAFLSLSITALFGTLAHVSAKDDYGVDNLFTEDEATERKIIQVLERHFGSMARQILAGRYQKPARRKQ